jgi:peptidoglycan/xylan/chitin deacetylase (PgdA/CDA1 family)
MTSRFGPALRRTSRTVLAVGCGLSGVLRLSERSQRRRLVILTYHRVLPAERKESYFNPRLIVTPETLLRHCEVLQRRFDVWPLSEAVQRLRGGRSLLRPLAAITFDDGYRDNFKYALPVMAATGLAATFFVVSTLIGADQPPWYDRLANALTAWLACRGGAPLPSQHPACALLRNGQPTPRDAVAFAKRLTPEARRRLVEEIEREGGAGDEHSGDDRMMTWPQLQELAHAGHEIGSHAATHEILTQLDDQALRAELEGSRQQLEDKLGVPVRAFSYPNGDFDARVAHATAEAQYECAVTVQPGTNGTDQDPYRLRRWFIDEDRLATVGVRPAAWYLRAELCGLVERMRWLRSHGFTGR